MTAFDLKHIYREVSRLKPLLALLALVAWSPGEVSWSLAVATVAGHTHHVRLRPSKAGLDVVLHHHHPIGEGAKDGAPRAAERPHGDHVIHSLTAGPMLAPSRLTHNRPPLRHCIGGDTATSGMVVDRFLLRLATLAAVGPAPPRCTVVLRI